jgi:L-2-hydroxyglutarate oxidase LhgO
VVHAGLYYQPGSLKATLCRRGVGLLTEFCAEHGITIDRCGKLVVACDADEAAKLDEIHARASANGVPDLVVLDGPGLRDLEPHAAGVRAVHSPSTAIVDYTAVARRLADDVVGGGGEIRLGAAVTALHESSSGVDVTADGERRRFDRVVLCAGLQSDRVARLAGGDPDPMIIPFRGEYHLLRPAARSLVRGLIYPVPDPRYPFLGVHFTKRVDGSVDIGPNAVLALAREGYRRRDVSWGDVRELAAWPGMRKLAVAHWRAGAREVLSSASRRWFVRQARRYVPELRARDVVPAHAGVRAQAVRRDGTLLDDFALSRHGAIVAVRNAPSPGATSSLAIAEHVCEFALGG